MRIQFSFMIQGFTELDMFAITYSYIRLITYPSLWDIIYYIILMEGRDRERGSKSTHCRTGIR